MISGETYEELFEILAQMDKQTVMKIPEEILNKLKNLRNKENNLEHSIKSEKNEKDIESLNNLKLKV